MKTLAKKKKESEYPKFISVEEAYKRLSDPNSGIIKRYLLRNPGIRKQLDEDELLQGAITHFIEKKFLERYNNETTSISYFLWIGVRNYAISYVTRKRVKTISENVLASTSEEEVSLIDYAGSYEEDIVHSMTISDLASQMINLVDSKERGKEVSHKGKTLRLSSRNVLELHMQGFTKTEISRIFGVSVTRISQIVQECTASIREKFVMRGENPV